MASVELHNIHKAYGALPVIHDVSLAIGDGEFGTDIPVARYSSGHCE